LNQKEVSLDVFLAKAQILVEATRLLTVEVNVEQLARIQSLRDVVGEVEARDGVVRKLGIDPDVLGMVERLDESQGMASRREVDVAARLVGLRLQRQPEVVALIVLIGVEEVEGLAEPLE